MSEESFPAPPSDKENGTPLSDSKDDTDLASKASLFESKERVSGSRPVRKRPSVSAPAANSISYQGLTINTACQTGNLPVCVLLWGIAAAKQVNLMEVDADGNNPIHYACLADNNEVGA